MLVKAKLLGKKNERRVVGWDGHALRRVREGDEFEIPDTMIEVDEIVAGQKTGKKIKKLQYFSERWMEPVTQMPSAVEVESRDPIVHQVPHPALKGRRGRTPLGPKSTGDTEVV